LSPWKESRVPATISRWDVQLEDVDDSNVRSAITNRSASSVTFAMDAASEPSGSYWS
jgi:hypothetical protein